MQLITKPISKSKLKELSQRSFGTLVKAVVDIEKKIMVIDAAMHADEETHLLHHGSAQDNLWGINIYPDETEENMIEFDSMINVRPRLHNMTRGIENEAIRNKIASIVQSLITV